MIRNVLYFNFSSWGSKLGIFSLLLIISQWFLLQPGQWFYQDTSYWPKTIQEAYLIVNQQLLAFSNYGYFLGFDMGLFAYTRIFIVSIIALLFFLFGAAGAQIAFSVLGIIAAFFSFYFFSSFFEQDGNKRFVISLLYVFNPFLWSYQGYTIFLVTAPLFIYSFIAYLLSRDDKKYFYLLLNIISCFIWISYIRFIQSNLLLCIPYVLFLLVKYKEKIHFYRIVFLCLLYLVVFSPTFFMAISQIIEKSQTAFYYAAVYGSTVAKEPFINSFTYFVDFVVHQYQPPVYSFVGSFIFVAILFGLARLKKGQLNGQLLLHLGLILLFFTIYGLANIFNQYWYGLLIRIFPFVINNPTFALGLLSMPLLLLVSSLFLGSNKRFFSISLFIVLLTLLPATNSDNFDFRKVVVKDVVPEEYIHYFIEEKKTFPEATFFVPNHCWRSTYMDVAQIPTMCLNFDLSYSSIFLTDPRLNWGDSLAFSKGIDRGNNFLSLLVTHNLKHVFIANDYQNDQKLGYKKFKEESFYIDSMRSVLEKYADLFEQKKSQSFDIYASRLSDDYNFHIYSPDLFLKNESSFSAEMVTKKPVFLEKLFNQPFAKNVNIFEKSSIDQPTIYFLHIRNDQPQLPVFLQFNQAFSTNWKLSLIDKATFESVKCIDEPVGFFLTQNSLCKLDDKTTRFSELLVSSNRSEYPHFKSNILNNGWIIDSAKSDLYIAIYYDKQVYFMVFILISLSIISALLIVNLSLLIERIFFKDV